MVYAVYLPALPDDGAYQIWVKLQNRMVNLHELSNADRYRQQTPYTENVLGLSI